MAAIAFDLSSDDDLVAAWQRGDELAASELVQRHAPALGRYLVALGAATSDVEDILQDAFFKAFRRVETWSGDGSFRGWLFRIGANVLRDRFRGGRGRTVLSLDGHDVAHHDDPAAELAASDVEARLAAALLRLPPMQRAVFLLRAQQGMDYIETARAAGTTPGAARVHYHHAVRQLKEWIQ
ncbi:MAG: RNA polymerase sigma factor [Gemmatimonadales bacterium]